MLWNHAPRSVQSPRLPVRASWAEEFDGQRLINSADPAPGDGLSVLASHTEVGVLETFLESIVVADSPVDEGDTQTQVEVLCADVLFEPWLGPRDEQMTAPDLRR